jgi:DNA polymerase
MPWPAATTDREAFAHPDDDGTRESAYAMATLHPSAVLRADDTEAAYAGFVADLRIAAFALQT